MKNNKSCEQLQALFISIKNFKKLGFIWRNSWKNVIKDTDEFFKVTLDHLGKCTIPLDVEKSNEILRGILFETGWKALCCFVRKFWRLEDATGNLVSHSLIYHSLHNVMNITQDFFVEFILEYNFPCLCKILRYPLLDISTGTPIDIAPVNWPFT